MKNQLFLLTALLLLLVQYSFSQNIAEVSFECKNGICNLKTQFSGSVFPEYFVEIEKNGVSIYYAKTSSKVNLGKYKLKGNKHIKLEDSTVDGIPVLKLKLNDKKADYSNLSEKLKKNVFVVSWSENKPAKKIWLSKLKPEVQNAKTEKLPVGPNNKEPSQKAKADKVDSKNNKLDSQTNEELPIDKFAKSLPKTELNPDQLFGFEGIKKEMVVLKLTKAFNDPKEKKVIFELKPGDIVIQSDKTGKYSKVSFGKKKAYVLTKSLKASASLTPVQNEKLKKLALEIVEKKKKSKVGISPEEKKQEKESKDTEKSKEFKKDTKFYTYSRFGRKDPFIPYEDEIEEGMNIDAVQIVGIIWEESSPIVILEEVNGSGATYTLKENDPIQNGKVFKITPNEVVFELTEFGITRKFAMQLPNLQEEGAK